jgi:magnesium chelatase subunit I
VFASRFEGADARRVVEWFELGGSLPLGDDLPAAELIGRTAGVQGIRELAEGAGAAPDAPDPVVASALDFVLEGLCAERKISRSEERGYAAAPDAAPRRQVRREEPLLGEEIRVPGGSKKKYYN